MIWTLRRLFVALLLLVGAAQAQQDYSWMTPRCKAKALALVTSPSQNAVLYAAFDTPGCYASGSTALAKDGSGTAVAMTISRASTAYTADVPGALGATWWRACTSNQLRVSGDWVGALTEQAATNLFLTPTDSPTSSGNWALIAAGPTVTANSVAWMDGTTTATTFVESAGVVSGIKQSVNLNTNPYIIDVWFNYYSRLCWGFAVDGTVIAKFDIQSGTQTYPASGGVGGVSEHSGGWVKAWARIPAQTAGAHDVQIFATNTCTDSVMAATGGTATTYIARVMLEQSYPGGPYSSPTSYAAAGAARSADLVSFPITWSATPTDVNYWNGSFCLVDHVEPFGSPLSTRANNPAMSAFGGATTYGAANSMELYNQYGTAWTCDVYDASGALKSVSVQTTTGLSGQAHVAKCCTNAAGTVALGYDGSVSKKATGAGTGILGAAPTVTYLGVLTGAGLNPSPIAHSGVAVCGAGAGGDPNLCSDSSVQSSTAAGAVGDSITTGVAGSMTTSSWVVAAAAGAGVTVMPISRASWDSNNGLLAWQASGMAHRYRKVAVFTGTNGVGLESKPAGNEFDSLKQVYQSIAAVGAIPVPVTVMVRSGSGALSAAQEIERKSLNASIIAFANAQGWPYFDASTWSDDGTYGGTPGILHTPWDNSDGLHLNAAGEAAFGAAIAPKLQ